MRAHRIGASSFWYLISAMPDLDNCFPVRLRLMPAIFPVNTSARYSNSFWLLRSTNSVANGALTAAMFAAPMHPYTRALLASRPSMDPTRRIEHVPVTGDPPNPVDLPPGCRFAPRCRYAEAVCTAQSPPLTAAADAIGAHAAACYIHIPDSGHSRAGLGLPADDPVPA